LVARVKDLAKDYWKHRTGEVCHGGGELGKRPPGHVQHEELKAGPRLHQRNLSPGTIDEAAKKDDQEGANQAAEGDNHAAEAPTSDDSAATIKYSGDHPSAEPSRKDEQAAREQEAAD
jgi:hypothetical protein